jgi:WD40 repeat protein
LIAAGQLGVDVFQRGVGKVHFHLSDDAQEQHFLAVTFSHDGKRLIAASQQGPIYVWNVVDKKLLHKLMASPGRKLMKLSPDDKQLALVSSNESRVRIWDVDSGKLLNSEPGNAWAVESIAYSPDGAVLATGSFGSDTQIWEMESGKHIASLPATGQDLLAFANQGETLLTFSGGEQEIVAWRWKTAEVEQKLRCTDEPKDSAYVRLFLSGDHGRMLRLTEFWMKKPRIMEAVEFPSMKPLAMSVDVGLSRSGAITSDGKLVAINRGNDIDLYDVAAQKVVGTLQGHTSWCQAMAFSPDDKQLLSGGRDCVLRVWNVTEQKEIYALTGQGRTIGAIAICPNGRVAATCGMNLPTLGRAEPIRHIVLWDLKEGVQLDSYSGHDVDGQALAFSPDGKRLASGLDDGTTIVWETPELAWK